MIKNLCLIFSCFFSSVFAQSNYSAIDSFAMRSKYKGDLHKLVYKLTNKYENDLDKTRAIYSWITENIKYDWRKANRKRRLKSFKCKGRDDCGAKQIKFEDKIINNALQKKKAICSGYSLLFKRMCDIAVVNAQVVDGYTKFRPKYVGKMGAYNHAWNTVIIDNKTYYLDLTWASGYGTENKKHKLTSFVKQRNDFYWLTPVEKFTAQHYPKKPENVRNFSVSKADYQNQPYIDSYILPDIENVYPQQGLLQSELNDTIVFKFDYSKAIEKIQINTNVKRNPAVYYFDKKNKRIYKPKALPKQEYTIYTVNNNSYEFKYVVTEESLNSIEILFDYILRLKYLVKVNKR